MTTTITPTAHSSLVGGSTASRRIGCPRSFHLEQLVPEDTRGSVYAQEGTALHEVMALALEHDREPTEMIPFTFTSEREGWSFTVDMDLWLDKGEPALIAFDKFVAEQEQRMGEPMRFLIETRVEFPGIPGAFGTSDIIGRCGNEIFVLDWKFGRGIVPAEENKQLMFYACGALNTARHFFEHMTLTHDTPVTMAIIQPARQDGIDVWRTDLLRLHHYEIELMAAVSEIKEDGANARIADGSWCTFARCKSICPLHLGAAAKLAGRFADLKAAMDRKTAPPPPDMAERYADLLALADMVEDWCKEVREQAHEAANRGTPIPGWVLEPGRKGPRKWAMEEHEVVELLTSGNYNLDLDTVAPRKPLTLPQIEKILKRSDIPILPEWVTQSEPTSTRLVRVENATEVVQPTAARAQALAEKLMRL